MAAYIISQARVLDPEKYEKYRLAALPLLERSGARYVARTADVERLEGPAWGGQTLAVLEFPSLEAAREFWASPEYQEVQALREGAAEMEVIMFDGYQAP
jgi:uncharacterized protein (DUF1330 family)